MMSKLKQWSIHTFINLNDKENTHKSFNYLCAGDWLETSELLGKIRQPDGVVQDPVRPVVIGIRPSHDTDHRQVLTVSPCDGVEHAETPNRERHHARAHTPSSRVPISRIAGVQLVAAADQVQLRLGYQVVQ